MPVPAASGPVVSSRFRRALLRLGAKQPVGETVYGESAGEYRGDCDSRGKNHRNRVEQQYLSYGGHRLSGGVYRGPRLRPPERRRDITSRSFKRGAEGEGAFGGEKRATAHYRVPFRSSFHGFPNPGADRAEELRDWALFYRMAMIVRAVAFFAVVPFILSPVLLGVFRAFLAVLDTSRKPLFYVGNFFQAGSFFLR